jgi:hypothetical protein
VSRALLHRSQRAFVAGARPSLTAESGVHSP